MPKKSLSIILSVLMLIAMISVFPLTASAHTADLAEEAAQMELAETGSGLSLQALMQKFPQGAYWNHQVIQTSGKRDEYTKNNPDGYTWHPCYSHSVSTPVGEYTCNIFDYAMQCYGFALKIAHDVYGSYFYDWKIGDIKKCKPGDVIVYTHTSVFSGTVSSHTFMVIGRSGNTITIGECNFDRHCQITWDRTASLSSYAGTHPTCYSAPYQLPSYALDTPRLTSVKSSAAGMTVSWKAVENAAKYRVYVKGGSATSWKALADTTKTSYTFANAVYGTRYTFTVRAINSKGKIDSDFIRNGISGSHAFAPTAKVTATNGKIAVTWDAVAKAAKYRVYVKGGKYTSYTKLTDTTKTAYNFTAGVAGTAYRFSVRCLGSDSKFSSDASPAVSATFIKTLATPTGFKAVATNKQGAVNVSWSAVKGATKYRVFYKRTGVDTSWQRLADVSTNSYTHTGCANNTEYTYTVRCLESNGTYISGYEKNGVTLHYFRFPTGIKAVKKDNKGHINVTWNGVKGAAKYAVYCKIASAGWQKITVTDSNSYIFTGAKNGIKYTFTVRACDERGRLISSFDSAGAMLKYTTK